MSCFLNNSSFHVNHTQLRRDLGSLMAAKFIWMKSYDCWKSSRVNIVTICLYSPEHLLVLINRMGTLRFRKKIENCANISMKDILGV